jgi:quercetin dioxygenase-like cupin family protein
MKIFRFGRETGRTIDRYKSSGFLLSRTVHLLEEGVVHCAYLDPNGLIGYHQATVLQLFLVLQGQGWVRGESPERTMIEAGQAAYWEIGEWHEAGTETGMTGVIVEATAFNLSEWVPFV